jgi:putative membrane protein
MNVEQPSGAAPHARVLATGFLMGLANLVPGVSGGTMVLAMGLYDRFIAAVAALTTLRPSRPVLVFLAVLAVGLFTALIGLAGPAVWLVASHRWAMYSLFIGMTLGGAPALLKLTRPWSGASIAAALVGLGAMVALFLGLSHAAIPQNALTFVGVGALAAASMILPGVSGSYILLIFGMYDVVVGSLSAGALKEDVAGSLGVIAPVGIGAALGIGLLSNVLKAMLVRWPRPSHGLLLGLLVGAVLGLWPFQEAVNPEIATNTGQKAVLALVEGASPAAVRAEFGVDWDDARAAELAAANAGATRGTLKAKGGELNRFTPGGGRVAGALALVALGFAVTLLLGGSSGNERPVTQTPSAPARAS